MKINATLCKPDGLYGMVMPKRKHDTGPSICACQDCLNYMYALQSARDAAVMYEDQQKVMRLLPTHAVTKIISPREYEMTPGVYPLPEPLDCEQIRLFRYKAIGHSLWLGWVESVTEYDLDVKISQETKPETKLVLRISQGTDSRDNEQQDRQDESDFVDSYFKVGVEEKKDPETCTGPWNCKCKVCEAMRVSEREELKHPYCHPNCDEGKRLKKEIEDFDKAVDAAVREDVGNVIKAMLELKDMAEQHSPQILDCLSDVSKHTILKHFHIQKLKP